MARAGFKDVAMALGFVLVSGTVLASALKSGRCRTGRGFAIVAERRSDPGLYWMNIGIRALLLAASVFLFLWMAVDARGRPPATS